MKSNYKILSVGGSIIIPKTGFDIKFLKKFRHLIIERVKKGDKFILVVGGGVTCRQYQQAVKKVVDLSNDELDWLGIYTTWYNAEFVKLLFAKLAYQQVMNDPTKKVKTNKPIIIAGGWKPRCSTDLDTVIWAKTYQAKELINLSNIDYIYTADPKTNKKAKPLKNLTWKQMKEIIGTKWSPGANLPFDPKATTLAAKLGLRVIFVQGTNLKQVKNSLNNMAIKGTIIY